MCLLFIWKHNLLSFKSRPTAPETRAIIVIDLSPANMVMRSVASGIPEKRIKKTQ